MFDTIHVDPPLICPVCGTETRQFQTKEFGSSLAHFKLGSVLSGSSVLTGIVKDTLWCQACSAAGRPSESPVYIVVWHSLLAGVAQEVTAAEARAAAVDRLDLIGWLDDAQREAARWRRHYHALYRDVSRWHQHLARAGAPEPAADGAGAERRRALRRLFDLPEEILTAPDPLAALLAANRHEDEEADD